MICKRLRGDAYPVTTISDYLSLLASVSGQNEDTGESWWGDGWCARFGKRLFYSHQDHGDRVERFENEDHARDAFDEYEQLWLEADDDDPG